MLHHALSERVGLDALDLPHIRVVLGSNLGRNISDPD
jgi:hypothetical protein